MSQTFKWCVNKTRLKTFNKQVFQIDRYRAKRWFLNGKLHRVNGPAVEYANGYKAWFLNDKRHRENGPAVEYACGTRGWYLNGREYYPEYWYWKEMNK